MFNNNNFSQIQKNMQNKQKRPMNQQGNMGNQFGAQMNPQGMMMNQQGMPMNQNMFMMNQMNQNMFMGNNFNNINFNVMNPMFVNNMGNNNFIPNHTNNQFNNTGMNNNNNFMQNSSNLKKELLKSGLKEKDPFKIQMKIALGLNNNKAYEQYLAGGNQVAQFFKQSTIDNRPMDKMDNKINITFKTMQGNKHNRFFNKTDTIKQMLITFLESVGLKEYHLKKINFLFNATNLNTIKNEKMTIHQFGFRNYSTVTVIDLNNIIGA